MDSLSAAEEPVPTYLDLLRVTTEVDRTEITLDEVAPVAVEAVIAAEDARFRDHDGVARYEIYLGARGGVDRDRGDLVIDVRGWRAGGVGRGRASGRR